MRYSVTVRFGGDGRVVAEGEGELTVLIRSPPERGKANRELVKKLSTHFNVPEGRVRIVAGHTSRKKIVEIS